MAEKTYPQSQATSPLTDGNALDFAIERAKALMRTCTVVQIKKVTNTGAVAAIGRVDVLPLVNMVDGIAQTVKHQVVHSICYCRLVGGTKAVILDPVIGDIGVAVFADRDISAVKASKKQSPPGSARKHNMADGVYITSVLAEEPTSYVQFQENGTIVMSPDSGATYIKIEAGKITLKADRIDNNPP